jgi:hypothetical protein
VEEPLLFIIECIRQIEICTAEPVVYGSSPFEVEIVIAKLKKFKLSGSDQIPAGEETLL